MKNTSYTVQIIEPSDGYTLTQAGEMDVIDRIFSKKIFLAVNDSIENWKEITDAEADAMREVQEIFLRNQAEKNK